MNSNNSGVHWCLSTSEKQNKQTLFRGISQWGLFCVGVVTSCRMNEQSSDNTITACSTVNMWGGGGGGGGGGYAVLRATQSDIVATSKQVHLNGLGPKLFTTFHKTSTGVDLRKQAYNYVDGSLQSLDWDGGMERWNGILECVLRGERSLLMQFSMKVTVGVLFLIR